MPREGEEQRRDAIRAVLVVLLTATVALVDRWVLFNIDVPFIYFLPIIPACIWFGYGGLLIIPALLGLYHWNTRAELLPGEPYPRGNDLARLLSFSLVATLTLLAERRYQTAREAQRLQESLRQAAEARGTRLEALYRVASAANASRGAEEFLTLFLEEVQRLLPRVCIATVLEREGDRLIRRAAVGPGAAEELGAIVPVGHGIAGRVALAGKPLVLPERQLLPADVASDWVRAAQPAAVLAVPMVVKGDTIGVVTAFGERGARFTADDVRILELMAAEAALVLESLHLYDSLRRTNEALQERQRLLDEQLSLAREVQRAILSVCPERCVLGRLAVASCHQSAWAVGGDLLRIVPREEGTNLYIGDVMGKGVPAALLMTLMTAELSSPNAPASDPGAVLAEANRVFMENIAALEAVGFITVCYLYITSDGRRLCYASAGHPPAILVHADGTTEELLAQSLPLGILRDADYSAVEYSLQAGDRLVLYTDGVTEARDAEGAFYGAERLRAVALAHHHRDVTTLRNLIMADVRRFTGARPLADDIALVVVGIDGEEAGGEQPESTTRSSAREPS
ncbi:MAG: SpoIIE family protein phosphatase [Armatimonadetes bacterium]|nr:SpoIIE family protein phosphatase [Armatimonadota bacterium]